MGDGRAVIDGVSCSFVEVSRNYATKIISRVVYLHLNFVEIVYIFRATLILRINAEGRNLSGLDREVSKVTAETDPEVPINRFVNLHGPMDHVERNDISLL